MKGTRGHEKIVFDGPPPKIGFLARLLGWFTITLCAALWALAAITPLAVEHQAVLGGVIFLFAWGLNRFSGRYVTLALMFISLVVSSRYMY